MNGRGIQPAIILRHIEQAREIGFQVKVNMVVQKGVNDREIVPMAGYCKSEGITLRFIEFMDVGNENGWNLGRVVTKREIFERLGGDATLQPVCPDHPGEVPEVPLYRRPKPRSASSPPSRKLFAPLVRG